jgi:hexosaminidase
MAIPLSEIIPAPASVHCDPSNDFVIGPETTIVAVTGSEAATVGEWLARLLRRGTGMALPVVAPDGDEAGTMTLGLDTGLPCIGDEGYLLTVTRAAITLRANTAAGLFHGAQTLRQLLPAGIEKEGGAGPWAIAGGQVTDHPRYRWRGAMLDVARHFFGVDDVIRYIDHIALYKMNVLHLHLTDDQGWRIAIAGWPRLTEIGGSTVAGGVEGTRFTEAGEFGVGVSRVDVRVPPAGAGFYTQADYRRIVAHALSRHVNVVPEVDGPGHCNAALASYAELNCDGQAPPVYTGIDVGFSSLCVAKPVTYRFLADVYGELAAMTPGPHLCVGGDEANNTSNEDYVAYMDRVLPLVAGLGKTPVGWAQIARAPLPSPAIAVHWKPGDPDSVRLAVERGARLVLAPADRCFLDMKYDAATPLGYEWAGHVSVRAGYDWSPDDYGIPADQVEGVEAPLWTETLTTMADLEQMAFPRLPGIAEVGWSPPSTHDWSSYRRRLAGQAARWQALGINFHRAPGVAWPG